DLILKRKWDTLQQDIFSRKSELCGYFGFYVFTKVLQHFECAQAVLLKYANSGDAMGDTISTRVVGYSSIVFSKTQKTQKAKLSPSDKEYLLNLARRSIEYYLDNKEIIKPEKPESKILNEDRAVFVTLTRNHNLRGCIGQLMAQMPLYQAVAEMAVSAAFQDYRFNPVKRNELKDISIEISVLTPMKRVKSIDEIKMGRDGVYVKKGMRTGVFLPQVAEETGWDKKTFLENLCSHKAFLPKDAYLDKDIEIYIFQVGKFSED
ncbi:MAG: AmmeMemoRadiSam system protein A, partial [Candidatus Cloacimonadota bacterium]|nr:AmmeMemoRadiSam system protein A [Candidatus Cloacimonadota bacterium]